MPDRGHRPPGRPKKPCACRPFNGYGLFKPARIPMRRPHQVRLGLDELEAMRLCDVESLYQSIAARRMGVSRGTVQRLLDSGRRKVTEAILKGHALDVAEEDHLQVHGGRGERRERAR